MAAVLALDVPMTLVGLDATNDVPVPSDIVDQLSADHGAAGADIAYEMYVRTPFLADGGNSYWDPLAAVTLTDPSIAGWEDMTVAMEPTGPGAGRLSRDPGGRPDPGRDVRRPRRVHGPVPGRAPDGRAAARTRSRSRDRWRSAGTAPRARSRRPAGRRPAWSRSRSSTRASGTSALLMGGAASPKTWDDVVAFSRAGRSRGPEPQGPRLDRPGAGGAEARPPGRDPRPSPRSPPARSASCAPPAPTPTSPSTTAARSPSAADAHQATSFQISGSSSPGRPPTSANSVDRPLEVDHRLVRPSGRVELVGEVVLDGGLEVQLAGPAAGDERRLEQQDRGVPVAGGGLDEGQRVAGRDRRAGVGVAGGDARGSASARCGPRRGRRAPAPPGPADAARRRSPAASSSAVPTSRARAASELGEREVAERTATTPAPRGSPRAGAGPASLDAGRRRAGRARRRDGWPRSPCRRAGRGPGRGAARWPARPASGVDRRRGLERARRRRRSRRARCEAHRSPSGGPPTSGCPRASAVSRWSSGLADRVDRRAPARPPRGRPRPPRRRDRRRARDRRSGRAGPGRRGRPGPRAAPRRRADAAAAAGRGSSPRRRRRAGARARNRTRARARRRRPRGRGRAARAPPGR